MSFRLRERPDTPDYTKAKLAFVKGCVTFLGGLAAGAVVTAMFMASEGKAR